MWVRDAVIISIAAFLRDMIVRLKVYQSSESGAGRRVGSCYPRGQDVAEALVRAGLTRDCPAIQQGHYAVAEQAAAANQRQFLASQDVGDGQGKVPVRRPTAVAT